MNGVPAYGTGRHEAYLTQQDERAEVARDLEAEQEQAGFLAWYEAQAWSDGEHGWGDMADAFKAGMKEQRDLDAARLREARS
jgi:hypothetical protein